MPSKILIVDDEPFNLDLLEQELTDLGYAVERANDGAQALSKVEMISPDLVLLDYRMPDMNGIEVLHAIRQSHKEPPVVIVTAHGNIELAVEAISQARTISLQTLDPEHLALVVKNVWRAPSSSPMSNFAQELGAAIA
jgi:CheY-like chemotaxis protein